MAKKIIKKEENSYSFNELQNILFKISPNAKIMHESAYSNINEWFSTGNYAMNAQLSGSIFGGIQAGRVTLFAGDPGAGKTFMALNACREAQKQGYYIVYIDTEWAVDRSLMERFGVDASADRVAYHPINTVEDVNALILTTCETLLEQKKKGVNIPKILFVIDSLGNLSTRRELQNILDGEEKADMGNKQKLLKKLFSTCTLNIGLIGATLIATQHTISNLGGYGDPRTVAGGIGQWYNSSTVIQISKAKLKDGSDPKVETGIISTSKVKKSRFTKRGIPISFHISDEKGMNPFVGLEPFISWETCGIAPGKILPNGEIEPAGKKLTSFAVKHLSKNIKPSKLFSAEVFTQEVLEKLDPYMASIFKLNSPADNEFDSGSSVFSHLEDEEDDDTDLE